MRVEKFSHCLRPVFTESLVKDLQEGRSLNLVGENGQGRWRLLEDVEKCHLRNTLILAINMKSYKQSYDGFVQALWQQAGETAGSDLGSLLTVLEQQPQKIVFWLHDFDALLDNPDIDERYNTNFTDSVNSIKTHHQWSLVCVTNQSYRKYIFIVNGKPLVSPLDLTAKPLPKLSFEEIRYELKNRNLSLSSEELAQVTSAIHEQKMPYRLLWAIADNLHNQVDTELSLLERLEKWKKRVSTVTTPFSKYSLVV
ncbi:MAG: hypothetical protein BWK79_07945 [Beggiatoa sp. IS2]|nr:MAG: hypothetical protein BWK79_07945 [Beggiatoa sp. IS2]